MKSWDELGAGMLVVVKGCMRCGGGKHRGMLIQFEAESGVTNPLGVKSISATWSVSPEATCGMDCITPGSVAARHVYRVIDPLADDSQYTEELARDERMAARRKPAVVR